MSEESAFSTPYDVIGVIGAGAWGTALAQICALAGRRVVLWGRDAEHIAEIRNAGENARHLPDITLPAAIAAEADLSAAAAADALLIAIPAQHLREMLPAIAARSRPGTPLVLCAKGIERGSGKLLTELLAEVAPGAEPAILSGPSFARDVARGLPTAVTVAARMEVALRLQASFSHDAFRPYASDDLTGVALGGAAKNVYAIACGMVDGLGLGESARAALIARSFAELSRLGAALGARPETLMGLSGLGDLVLTATSPTSRNFSFGRALGGGASRAELAKPGHPLAEGVETAPALVQRARAASVDLPIAQAVASVLDGRLPLGDALLGLMRRPLKPE